VCFGVFFFFSSRRRHTRFSRDWSSDVCSSDLETTRLIQQALDERSTAIDDVTGASALIEKLNLLVDVMHEEQGNAARDRSIINRSEERRVGKEWRYQ